MAAFIIFILCNKNHNLYSLFSIFALFSLVLLIKKIFFMTIFWNAIFTALSPKNQNQNTSSDFLIRTVASRLSFALVWLVLWIPHVGILLFRMSTLMKKRTISTVFTASHKTPVTITDVLWLAVCCAGELKSHAIMTSRFAFWSFNKQNKMDNKPHAHYKNKMLACQKRSFLCVLKFPLWLCFRRPMAHLAEQEYWQPW